MYVDYNYYTTDYLQGLTPRIQSTSFLFLEKKAESYLNQKTRGAYMNVTDENVAKVKDCICALADNFNNEMILTSDNGVAKQSESVGGHSVSYAIGTSSSVHFENERRAILNLYLWDLGIVLSRKVFGIHEG